MFGRASRCSKLVWSIALLAGSVPAYGQRTGRPAVSRSSGERCAIVVMGEVRRSGVYSLPASRPSLADVLTQAGHLKGSATGSVKVIRGGRMTLQTHVKSGGGMSLRDGDVIIAAGREDRSARAKPAGPIEVALLDLIDRPVLVQLRAQHADVQSLLSLLHQSPATAHSLRILGPVSRDKRGNLSLKSGAIVVFDAKAIDRERVPALPPAYVIAKPRVRTVQAGSAETRNGPILQSSRSNGDKTPSEPGGIHPPVQAPPVTARSQQSDSPKGQKTATIHDDQWRLAKAPAPGPLAGVGVGMPNGSGITAEPIEKSETAGAPLHQPASVNESVPVNAKGDEESSSGFLTLIVGLFAGLGVLAAGGFLWSMGRKAAAGDLSVRRVFRRPILPLDQLINNELEVCEEPFVTSASLEFFGRTSSVPQSRIDVSHATEDAAVSGPHFVSKPLPADSNSSGQTESTPRADDRHTSPPAPSSTSTGVLDRALSSVLKKESL